MGLIWTRRRALQQLLAAVGSLAVAPRCTSSAPRKSVAIVGGGAAGIMTAWLLDGAFDVVLIEQRAALGGNVQTIDVDVRGQQAKVDVGAQYFHPGPYPTYVALLQLLGLFDPDHPDTGGSYSAPSSITVYADGEPNPRFVSPILPSRTWPASAPWNADGVAAFAALAPAAVAYEHVDGDYLVTLGDWLGTVGLTDAQRTQIVVPWVSSLFSGDIAQGLSLSARAALVFLSRAYSGPLANVSYYTLQAGMSAALDAMVSQCTTLTTKLGVQVVGLSGASGGGHVVALGDGSSVAVDEVVFASPGEATASILSGVAGFDAQVTALDAVQWSDTSITIHRDPAYAPADPMMQSFLNCRVQGTTCEASMSLASVLAPLPDGPVSLWKSWTTHRQMQPADVVTQRSFRHVLPTPATITAQRALAALQGQGGVWFAGGYTLPSDSQESALLSALSVAHALMAGTQHLGALAAACASSSAC